MMLQLFFFEIVIEVLFPGLYVKAVTAPSTWKVIGQTFCFEYSGRPMRFVTASLAR